MKYLGIAVRKYLGPLNVFFLSPSSFSLHHLVLYPKRLTLFSGMFHVAIKYLNRVEIQMFGPPFVLNFFWGEGALRCTPGLTFEIASKVC